ncbi:SUKH-4 family immunity protein [Streptomyces globisporus]|uniref:SUKH-4 family immunity protein n=1 Tax=Streptomyces globisporus TaxID=1908 RepID=UPI00379C28F4|nr:SUKH-4 family immunity protein [Streptomyces globisporus]
MLTYDELVGWAGAENVGRADPGALEHWLIPDDQKAILVDVGVPVAHQLIEYPALQPEAAPQLATNDGRQLYQLTANHHRNLVPGLLWAFGVEPRTGTVYYVLPGGEPWFANSSVELWLTCLHHYGLNLTQSNILDIGDELEEQEEGSALAYFHRLAAEVKEIDPAAFDGPSSHLIWPEILELWYW